MPRAGSLALFPSLEHRGHRLSEAQPTALEAAVARARGCLLDMQNPDGHWVGELQGDTILESEYVLLMAFLGRDGEERVKKAARYILTQERPDGGWSNYPGGPVDLSVSVKAYFALKIAGHDPDAPYMRRARQLILDLGGAASSNSFTKCYLASLGQLPYDNCPTVPPELLLLPKWSYVNIHAMSSWTRTIVVPLSIFSAHRPVRAMPPEKGVAELFAHDPHVPLWPHPPTRRWFTLTNLFIAIDQAIKWFERRGPRAIRQLAIRKAEQWMIDHFAGSDGVGAIFPPIIYTIISLRCLGYADDSPEMSYALEKLDDLMIEDEATLRVQPCFSPVWDTALSLNALAISANQSAWIEEEERNRYAINRGIRWLLQREVRDKGDWSLANPHLEPGGWFFEYRNRFYPDTDDTAMVLMGLARSGHAWDSDGRRIPPVERGLSWLLGMQNSDGGWGAFDRDINREILTKIPFADHNAMLDPSCPDITARALEALGQFGYLPGNRQVDDALAFLERKQDRRGCWQGRWGVNYLYGTWQVLIGLQAIGYDMRRPTVRRAVAWLESVQQECGGWGESCRSYDDPSLAGQGDVTASQTAWALLGLIAAGRADSRAVHAGIQYLLRTQQDDGNWHEDQFTGTGFPKVFYLKYHMYRLYFPFMALARYQEAGGRKQEAGVGAFSGYKFPA
ncbi:MAG: squalene--hopene cyclase [Planctomycetes bacterium]|nr:squalene--hopene cyclase [Planctomycetota bacterium]